MPYSKVSDLPDAFKNQSAAVKRKGLEILNAILREGESDEGKAIRIALSRAQKWAREHTSKGGVSMKEGGEFWFDEDRGEYFVGFTATTKFFKGKTDDESDHTLCFQTEVVTDDFDLDKAWFSPECMKALANPGSVPLLVGDSHKAAMINATSKVGTAIDHEVFERAGATILLAKGEFNTRHPDARWLWEEARMNAAEYGTSIGGWVKPDWVEQGATHQSGAKGMRIDMIERDHYLLCRASAARNPNTTFASAVGKALGDDDEPVAEPIVTEKAWAGLSDKQVRRAVEDKLYDVIQGDDGAVDGYAWVVELYEQFAIAQGGDGTYYKLALNAKGGTLVVGDPVEVKRTYAEKCWCDEHYPLNDTNGDYEKQRVVHARTRVSQRQIGWAQALPEVRKAYEKLGLKWGEDASGEAIDPAILAEDEEVFLAASAGEGDQMSELTDRDIGLIARAANYLKGGPKDDEPGTPGEPAKLEPMVSEGVVETLKASMAEAVEAALAPIRETLDAHGESIEALKADGDEPAGDAVDEDKPKDTEDAETADGDEKPNETAEALKAIGETLGALGEKINAMTDSQAGLADRVEGVEKAKGISRGLPESTETGAGSEEEPGMEAIGFASAAFVKGKTVGSPQ